MTLTPGLVAMHRRSRMRTVRVRVKGGYRPPVVRGRVGEPLRMVFVRDETSSESEHVVFPAFGKSAMLPAFEQVTVELVPDRAGDFEFTSQTGVLRGVLAVADGELDGSTRAERLGGRASRWMSAGNRGDGETLVLVFAVWLCTLPLLLLVTILTLGWKTGAVLALVSIGIAAAACFLVCARRAAARSIHGAHGVSRDGSGDRIGSTYGAVGTTLRVDRPRDS
ncbi:MAG TPA: cupredoxin domain-containing protein [Gaiellaceae bacterium]|nr:cupredoxin domain-containing protein [Gaiellaceae bacterium]